MNTKKPKQDTIPFLDYSISSIQLPKLLADFDGYFLGTVYIHACSVRPALVGCTLRMRNTSLATLNTCFVYTTKNVVIEHEQLIVNEHSGIKALKENLLSAQVKDLIIKMAGAQNLAPELLQIALQMTCIGLPPSVPAQMVAQHLPACDLNRFPLIHVLQMYMVSNKYDEKQKRALMDMPVEQLHKANQLLCTEPWTLVFGFNKLKGMKEDMLERAVREFQLQFRFPLHIQYAVKMYFRLMQARLDENHTVFNKSMFNVMIPCMHVDKRRELEEQIFGYLRERAFAFSACGGESENVSTKFDHYDASSALTALKRIYAASLYEEPKLRGIHVPQLFPPLTARQMEIAQYITHHWLTIVEGMPGTGKTALITWCVSHYQNVMLVSFVGMMVKSLQKRNGRRREVAHTIHHVLAQKKHGGELAEEWLSKFEVLIVDEFSNVSMPLFRKLLCCLPNIKKVVLVGDHRQLKPIEGGDPMGDMIGIFGSQMLHDNLRVVPELKALQFAPALIAANQAAELNFTTPCLTFIDRSTASLLPIFAQKAKEVNILMNMHIVALVNAGPDGRDYLNKECQNAWLKLGVLQRPPRGAVAVRHNLELFPGCKITFLKNYNKPIEKTAQHDFVSVPVANGELCLVQSIERHGEGFILQTVDSLDPADDPESKMIWLHEKTGVSPKHVELGYATTVYKSQGESFFIF